MREEEGKYKRSLKDRVKDGAYAGMMGSAPIAIGVSHTNPLVAPLILGTGAATGAVSGAIMDPYDLYNRDPGEPGTPARHYLYSAISGGLQGAAAGAAIGASGRNRTLANRGSRAAKGALIGSAIGAIGNTAMTPLISWAHRR